jgi:hypothetical protein
MDSHKIDSPEKLATLGNARHRRTKTNKTKNTMDKC